MCKGTDSVVLGHDWFTYFKTCDDHLGLCQRDTKNATKLFFEMDFDNWGELDYIPSNYFCHFHA